MGSDNGDHPIVLFPASIPPSHTLPTLLRGISSLQTKGSGHHWVLSALAPTSNCPVGLSALSQLQALGNVSTGTSEWSFTKWSLTRIHGHSGQRSLGYLSVNQMEFHSSPFKTLQNLPNKVKSNLKLLSTPLLTPNLCPTYFWAQGSPNTTQGTHAHIFLQHVTPCCVFPQHLLGFEFIFLKLLSCTSLASFNKNERQRRCSVY